MKRAAIYARVSSERQAAEDRVSIEVQLADCEAYCNERGYTIVARYVDKEKYRAKGNLVQPSGQRKDRPGYLALLKAAAAGELDVIVAWKEDRLYRGMYAALPLSEILDELGKRLDIELVKETFDRKMLGIKAVLAKIESDNIRERMMMGRRARLERGEVQGGNQVKYGYKKVKRRLEIEEQEAGNVCKIFEWYTQGLNVMEIRRKLNTLDLPPRRGKLWPKSTIALILTTEAYATGQIQATLDGEAFTIPCPPIISMATWQKAQEMRVRNRNIPRYVKEDYLCMGLVYCACGWKCYGKTWHDNDHRDYSTLGYYLCHRRSVNPESMPANCVRSIGSKKLDNFVWNFVKELCDRPEVLRQAVLDKMAALEAQQEDHEAAAERLQKQLDQLAMERQWVITQARKGGITEYDMGMQLAGLELQELGLKKELNEKLAALEAQQQAQALSEWAATYLAEVGEGVKTLDVKPEKLLTEERQALAIQLEAWRFADKFPDDELAQLRWAILEEKRRTVRMLISQVIVSKVDGPEKRAIKPVLALEVPQDSEVWSTAASQADIC